MALSLIPLVIVCLVVAWMAGSCAFRPGGPSTGEIPQYDAPLALGSQAKQVPFPLRLPATPEGWTTSSGGTVKVPNSNGGVAVNLGYITDRTTFLQLAQSNLAPDRLQEFTASGTRVMSGEEAIGGQVWAVFSEEDAETVWLAQFPGVSVSITGSGSPAEFAKLAEALDQAPPLPTS